MSEIGVQNLWQVYLAERGDGYDIIAVVNSQFAHQPGEIPTNWSLG